MEHYEMSQSFVLQPRRARSGARIHLPKLLSLVRAIDMWLARRQGWQDLNLLDDRMLKDVGITREQVVRKARQPFRLRGDIGSLGS
jgi:uncharacterized protein YjiS (DUF1127 family)